MEFCKAINSCRLLALPTTMVGVKISGNTLAYYNAETITDVLSFKVQTHNGLYYKTIIVIMSDACTINVL